MCRFDEARRIRIIVEGLADLTNGYFENGFADKCPWPDRVEEFLFCDELVRMNYEIFKYCEGFGSELYCLCASPQALVGQIQAKGIEHYAFFVTLSHRTFPK